MTALEIVREARAKIERGWCKGRLAQNAEGMGCAPSSAEAAAWCLRGALCAEEYSYGCIQAMDAVVRELPRWACERIPLFNDAGGTYLEDVLDVLSRAERILLEEKDGGE